MTYDDDDIVNDPENRTGKYIINEKGEVEPCPNLLKWAKWYEEQHALIVAKKPNQRQVAQERFSAHGHQWFVSTVFLALDHNFNFNGDRTPVLWETMIFCDSDKEHPLHTEMDRYTSREAAERGHTAMVQRVKDYDPTHEHPNNKA